MTGYFLLYVAVAIWLFLDATSRRYNGIVWAVCTAILGPLVVPFYFAKRPLKSDEIREGGFAWNVLKYFAIFWTVTIFIGFVAGMSNASDVANKTTPGAQRAAAGVGMAIGGFMIFFLWFVIMAGALVLGFFLKKTSIVERGPTGPLASETTIFVPHVEVPLMWIQKVFSLRTRIILSVIGGIIILGRLSSHVSTSSTASSSSSGSTVTEHAPIQASISWDEIDAIYNVKSDNTELHKKEEWKKFKGKRVNWSGEVSSISDDFGGLTLQIKMNRDTFSSDLLIYLKRSERAKALRLQKGDSVTFAGKLDDWGTLLPITVNDGEIK